MRRFISSALDMVELLLNEVIDPRHHKPTATDFTKEIGEVAMLLRLGARAGGTASDRRRVQLLTERVAPLARTALNRRALVIRPSRSPPHCLAHACLDQLGVPDADFDRLARTALRATAAGAAENLPYRLLDVAWIRHLMFGDEELDHPSLPLTPIGVGVDLVKASVEDAYAFSHALPYATDFGRLPLPVWADIPRLSSIADALVIKALAEDDLDLLGELLMTPALLRADWSTTQEFGWLVLSTVWDERGYLPGPGLPEEPPGETSQDAIQRILGTMYHTTLVGGLLVATVLSTGRPPQGNLARLPPERALPREAPPGDKTWARIWAGLTLPESVHLAHLPTAFALHSALQDLDVERLLDVLAGEHVEQLPSELVLQSSEFLDRAAQLVGARGAHPDDLARSGTQHSHLRAEPPPRWRSRRSSDC